MMIPYGHQTVSMDYPIGNSLHSNPIHIDGRSEMENRMNQTNDIQSGLGINPLNVTHSTRPTSINQERRKQRRIRLSRIISFTIL